MQLARTKKISKQNAYRYIQLGLNVAYYRKLAGVTQEELAETVDLRRAYMATIEAPNMVQSISLEMLFQLADALSIEPSQLLEFRG